MPSDIHAGHRNRLRERFNKNGFNGFEEHEILEFILGYSIPQGNLNPLAHRLIDIFGSLSGVLEASYEDLCAVNGIGPYSATYLNIYPLIAREYLNSKYNNKTILNTSEQIGEFLKHRFVGYKNEVVYAIFMDNKCAVLKHGVVMEGSINSVGISIRKIAEWAFKTSATAVVIAHNHPNGIALPSSNDIATTIHIVENLKKFDISVIDHFIVGDNDYVSMASSEEYKGIFE